VEKSIKIGMILCIVCTAIAIVAISFLTGMISLTQTTQASVGHPEKREFWLFNSEIPGFNETKMGISHDVFSMPSITVNRGDTVVIHFFNTEPRGGDHHTFTISDSAYNINAEVRPGENKTITFDATTSGIFPFTCTFHQPTMTGQFIVQPTT
jgi:plastocyanin